MAQQKSRILKPLSATTHQALQRAMNMAWAEGYAVWGFVFAQQEAAERIMADGKDFVALDVFNNAQGVAGGNSIAEFIAKTRVALDVVSKMPPEGFDLQHEQAQLQAPFAEWEDKKKTPLPFETGDDNKKPN
jgi:hypothetical protein